MRNFRNIMRLAVTPQLIAMFALLSPYAEAHLMSDQCDISSNPVDHQRDCISLKDPSSGLYYSSTQAIIWAGAGPIDSVRTSPGAAAPPIDAWYSCRYVDNNGNDSLFVPFKTWTEWDAFIQNAGALNINLVRCSRPSVTNYLSIPDNYMTYDSYMTAVNGTSVNPFYQPTASACNTAQDQKVTIPVYGRTGFSTQMKTASFTCTVAGACKEGCTCGANQTWVEAALATFTAGASADGSLVGGQPTAAHQPSGGWQLSAVAYSGTAPKANPPVCVVTGGNDANGNMGCFVTGSLVLMADGRLRPIETLQFGDRVSNAQGGVNMVLRREICALPKGSDLYGFDGGKPMVTAYHPFVTAEGFAAVDPEGLRNKYPYFEDEIGPVSLLKAGIALLSPEGPRLVESVQKHTLTEEGTAYDLVLDGDQTYFVEGLAVRSQRDNAHSIRYLPHMLRDSACMARATAISAVYLSVGMVVSPMAALATSQASSSPGDAGDTGTSSSSSGDGSGDGSGP